MLGKRQKELLKFQKSGVIDCQKYESSSSNSDSEEKKEETIKWPTEFKKVFDDAIINGV